MMDRKVLFVCVENAGRSLLAEAIFNADPAPGWRAISAGTRPAAQPYPRTRRLLSEIGLELPQHPPQLATPEIIQGASVRISMGCLTDAACPANLRSLAMDDWALPDPATLDDAGVRALRQEIVDRVRSLKQELVRRDRSGSSRADSAL